MTFTVGSTHEVDILRIAHGGHCVGRIGDVVVFVRHTLPKEKVIVEITQVGKQGKFLFADAIEVLVPSPHRIKPACEYAGRCGGCDFQHIAFSHQQVLKTEVLKEQLIRLGKIPADSKLLLDLKVKPLPKDQTGLHYRTRVEYVTDSRGRIGFRKHGSNEVVTISNCKVAATEITGDGFSNVPWAPNSEARIVLSSEGEVVRLSEADQGDYRITETIDGFEYHVNAKSFWQAHHFAPQTFVKTVLDMMQIKAGQHVCDLYSGSGLFTLPLARAVGAGGRIESVESDLKAVGSLRRNTRTLSNVNLYAMGVEKWLATSKIKKVDAILLDPPRAGAGTQILKQLVKLRPSKILYVACDPASLARDVATLAENGYELTQIQAWDAFGQTQHLESFGLFTPTKIGQD